MEIKIWQRKPPAAADKNRVYIPFVSCVVVNITPKTKSIYRVARQSRLRLLFLPPGDKQYLILVSISVPLFGDSYGRRPCTASPPKGGDK